MRILVTGGTGFLGSYLMGGLAEHGHDPVSYDISAVGPEAAFTLTDCKNRCRFHMGQTTDLARLFAVCRAERIEAIIHNAGVVGTALSLEQPVATYQTNVMGAVNVYETARQAGIGRVIYISSNAVYHKGDGERLHERDSVFSIEHGNPAGHYGTSKMACEAIGLTYATFHGLDFLSLRVTAVYGFGMRQPMYIKPMVENAVDGRPTRFASGGPMRRDYTYVTDCVDAVCAAVDHVPAERVLNISSGVTYSASAVAGAVRSVLGDADIEIGESLDPLEAENVKMRVPLALDSATSALGWKPKWTLESGIRDYAARYERFRAAVHAKEEAR